MLKGIARADDDRPPEDRYAIVVALSELTKSISDAEAGSAFAAAAQASATLLRVGKAIIFYKSADGKLAFAGSAGCQGNDRLLAAAREAAGECLRISSPVVCPNTTGASTSFAKQFTKAEIASVICVPMRVGGSTVGAIVAMSEDLRAFSPSDIELLHVVASQAALAAWRLSAAPPPEREGRQTQEELIRLAQRKIQDLSLINQVSEALNSTLDLDTLLEIALKQSLMVVGADCGSLMLANEDTNKLEIVASRGLDPKWVKRTAQDIGVSIAGWVAEQGESVVVTDAHADPRFRMPFFRDHITSAASVPLKTKTGVTGVLNVNTVQPDKVFDERDLELLHTVANQMAVAIENARLYARVNRRTDQLANLLRVSRTMTSTLNLDEVLRRLTEAICRTFGLDVCTLLLLDELSGRFRFGQGRGLKTRRKSAYYDLAVPLAARVKETGKRLVLRNVGASRALRTEVSQSEGLRTAVCIPLKNVGKLVGVAVGFSRHAVPLARSQLDIIGPLGELAGVAVHNARVYRRKYRMAELLQHKLVPSDIPEVAGIEIGHKFLPAREVGGDYYDFPKVGHGRVGVVVADVSGSDIEAAEYTTMGKYVLRTYACEHDSPALVLAKTNDLICQQTRPDAFISLFYGVIDTRRRTLAYANAGCEPPLLYRSRTGAIEQLTVGGILLGIRGGMEFQERRVRLDKGDVLLAYTDGLTEASGQAGRFGAGALADMLRANAQFPAQQTVETIHDALLEFVHGRVTDDAAIVVVKIV